MQVAGVRVCVGKRGVYVRVTQYAYRTIYNVYFTSV